MLLVGLEMTPHTYHSKTFKPHVLSLYPHVYTYTLPNLHMVYLDCLQVQLASNSRWAWNWWSSQPWDILRGYDWASVERHLWLEMERTWGYRWGLQSCELGGHKRASFEMHFEAVTLLTWRPYASKLGHTLGGSNRVSLEIHLQGVIVHTWRR